MLDVYPARERAEDFPGVTASWSPTRPPMPPAGRTVAWLPTFDEAETFLAARVEAGDVCLAMGAGDVDQLGRRLVERGRRMSARRCRPASSPTTRSRGSRPSAPAATASSSRARRTAEQLDALLAWAEKHGHEVGVVGSGSNLLVADEGVRGLVMKLDKDLAQIERDGTRLGCGGGARLPPSPRAPRTRA